MSDLIQINTTPSVHILGWLRSVAPNYYVPGNRTGRPSGIQDPLLSSMVLSMFIIA